MKLLKLTLFTFICSIVLFIAVYFTDLMVFGILALFAGLISFAALVAWICTKMFHKFRYSLNVILIFIFFVLTVVTAIFGGATSQLDTYEDIANLGFLSLAWVLSVFALVISILVLIGRVIFGSKEIDKNAEKIDSQTEALLGDKKEDGTGEN